ncbi:xylulokinase [Robinsoniella peoriensis]|uniref:Xylulose kinase n=1 Tax=Robinsoniella peoriensis TaxID=180332 RepID=A0A4U8Q326_9FIRM|nr:FGGY family carbohydrate kinase [Robinsoniella peoriensis]MDU7029042.1 FGGY family carbohydrate kinase [Clostridiales bacterium]TLC98322.1 Xylulose kinase [Robinsoniella peoriensis]
MKYILTFDVGTTAMKCTLYNELFDVVFFDSGEYDLLTPEAGIVELPVQVYWEAFCLSIKRMESSGIDMEQIAAVTFTTQGETLIPIDANGQALYPAIVWIDSRAKEEARYLKDVLGEEKIYRHTGAGEFTGAAPAAKLMWLKEHKPEIYEKAEKFLLLEDYFIYRLTGRAVTEMALLSSTGWFDIREECYWAEMLKAAGLDEDKLPQISACGKIVGNVTSAAAAKTGLSIHTRVTTGAMDQVASAVGAGNIREGMVTETTGTALVVGAATASPDFANPQRITIYKDYGQGYLYMPFCNTAGIVLKWFRDTLAEEVKREALLNGQSAYDLIDELAKKSPAGSNGLILLAHFAGKPAPCPSDLAKGVFFGMTLATTKADFARAVLEGIGYMLKEIIETLEKAGLKVQEIRSMGGGAASPLWCEIKSGICQKPIRVMNNKETTSLGAAILGAVAVGICPSVEAAVEKAVHVDEPGYFQEEHIYQEGYQLYQALYRALIPVFEKL